MSRKNLTRKECKERIKHILSTTHGDGKNYYFAKDFLEGLDINGSQIRTMERALQELSQEKKIDIDSTTKSIRYIETLYTDKAVIYNYFCQEKVEFPVLLMNTGKFSDILPNHMESSESISKPSNYCEKIYFLKVGTARIDFIISLLSDIKELVNYIITMVKTYNGILIFTKQPDLLTESKKNQKTDKKNTDLDLDQDPFIAAFKATTGYSTSI